MDGRVYAVSNVDGFRVEKDTGKAIEIYRFISPSNSQPGADGDSVLIGSSMAELYRMGP